VKVGDPSVVLEGVAVSPELESLNANTAEVVPAFIVKLDVVAVVPEVALPVLTTPAPNTPVPV
jgi:hypothetical protein